ncbi:FixH family protein [Chitinophaga qingshengii]|uniref:FixH family protein n=1 Tax=Chitinophaga qingshengii TaxID=1569794 RepID=A0ABR7TMA1_9BACT|nr:FixH family protein [Chitinophaga qingshengii]MBC9931609.1 FixH family protein [Chitinophaga qingshengii]
MNWGHKIIIVFVVFAAGILTLVTKSMRTKIDMVTKDYYAEELKYQQVIDGKKNAHSLSAPVMISQQSEGIAVTFPQELHGTSVTGKIKFYRPSDAAMDVEMPLHLSSDGILVINRQLFHKGSYLVKLQWENQGKPFYQEESLHIN